MSAGGWAAAAGSELRMSPACAWPMLLPTHRPVDSLTLLLPLLMPLLCSADYFSQQYGIK